MLNVISRFINEKLIIDPEIRDGKFTASVMFTDVVGFTSITEKMMKKGKQGAEELSVLINKVYNPLISIVYRNGGYITNFAGDAITVVFPGDNGHLAMNAAGMIQSNFEKRRNYYRRFANSSEVNVRIGLSYGDVSWAIYGKERKAYSFHGPPVIQCAEITAGKDPGEIVVSESMSSILTSSLGSGSLSAQPNSMPRIKRGIVRQFVPESVLQAGYGGEFRNVVPVFIALKWSDYKTEVKTLIDNTLSYAVEFGGYFSPIFTADKEPHVLVIFGAPVSYENNVDRAVEFACGIREKFGNRVKAGITSGTVFAGSVGSRQRCTYTVLGDVVNQAARIMQKADWGQVWINSPVKSSLSSRFASSFIEDKLLKGKTDSVRIFSVRAVSSFGDTIHFQGEMVGRKKEMKQLKKASRPVLKEKFAGVTYIYGHAGVGKSRIITEFIRDLPEKIQSFTMQTDEILQKSFNPFIYFLKSYFQQSETAGIADNRVAFETSWSELFQQLKAIPDQARVLAVSAELNRTKSLLCALLGHDTGDTLHDDLDAKGRFENTLFALKELIKALSLVAPTVLILEDMHWLDSDSEAVLKNLTQNVANFPFIIIALSRFRDDGSRPRLEVDTETPVNELIVHPLSGTAEKRLMDLRLDGVTGEELGAFITDRTGGNPFYIEQFCCYLLENKALKMKSGEYMLPAKEFEIPLGIKSILVARIDRLSSKLKDLVQKASVLGREFNIQVLSAMLKSETVQINPLLAEGETEAIWSVLTEISFIFRHALLRDVIYGMQLQKQLQQLHRLAAEAMETLYEDEKTRYAALAYHYRRSGVKRKAQEYLRKAADYARDEYRNQEALGLYEQLVLETDTIGNIIEAELEKANILVFMGKWEEAEKIIVSNTEKAVRHNLEESMATCFSKHAKLLHRKGMNEEALEKAHKASAFYSSIDDAMGIASTRNILGNIYTVLGKFDEALENLSLSNDAAERAGDHRTIAMNISNIGNIYLHQYELDKAEKYYELARIKCDEINDKLTATTTLGNMAIICYYRLEYDKCQELFDEYISISEQMGNKQALAYIHGNIGVLHQELNDIDSALKHFNKQLQMGYELGDMYNISIAKRNIGQIHSIHGSFDLALDCLFETRDISRKIGDSRSNCMAYENIAMVYHRMGDYEKACENFLAGIEIADPISEKHVSSFSRLYLSQIYFRQNNYIFARNYMDEAIAIRRELEDHNQLLDSLIFSAEILLLMKEFKLASRMIAEAEEISREDQIDHNQEKLKLVRALLAAQETPERAEELLTVLKSEVSDEELSARINFELYRLNDSKINREAARNLYKKMYAEVPRAEFLEYLQKLDEK